MLENQPAEAHPAESLATAIYGTILSTSLITAYSEDQGSDPLQVAVAVFSASVVFWLAHAYSDVLARGLIVRGSGGFARVRSELRREWPLVTGATLPILPLFLAPLGLLSNDTAESVAIAAGIAMLTLVGVSIAWRRHSGLIGLAMAAAASALFGALVVILKVLVH
jgi:hypothetical protein